LDSGGGVQKRGTRRGVLSSDLRRGLGLNAIALICFRSQSHPCELYLRLAFLGGYLPAVNLRSNVKGNGVPSLTQVSMRRIGINAILCVVNTFCDLEVRFQPWWAAVTRCRFKLLGASSIELLSALLRSDTTRQHQQRGRQRSPDFH